ncbi:Zinc finger C2H2-type [Cinara cedri]|uniref:Zinc finger C2H2-type n=1 Tax=Cinara cedri TaxID=506608 RepID=A0A5E4NDI0_9HEMI|nr:Zinc finger C2H2-type [Cinara cedri]
MSTSLSAALTCLSTPQSSVITNKIETASSPHQCTRLKKIEKNFILARLVSSALSRRPLLTRRALSGAKAAVDYHVPLLVLKKTGLAVVVQRSRCRLLQVLGVAVLTSVCSGTKSSVSVVDVEGFDGTEEKVTCRPSPLRYIYPLAVWAATSRWSFLLQVYGTSVSSGRESFDDEQRCGRSSTTKTDGNIVRVSVVLNEHRNGSCKLVDELTSIPKTIVQRIIREDLGKRKLFARFVPRNSDRIIVLKINEKQQSVWNINYITTIHNMDKMFNNKMYKCEKSYELISSLNKHKKKIHSLETDESAINCNMFNTLEDEEYTLLLKNQLKQTTTITNKVDSQDIMSLPFNETTLETTYYEPCNQQLLKNAHKCNVCTKSFTCKSKLDQHNRIHTGEKPFSCNVCGLMFSHQSNLTSHSRIHTGEKPFACKICGMKFTQQCHLIRHIRIHTGEKPFKCTLCDMSFRRSCTRLRHTRRIHNCSF